MEVVDVPLGFNLGDKFKTVDEFHEKLVTACKNKYVQFYKRDNLTISAAAKKVKRYLNKDLEFYKVQYCCIHGGREFKTEGTCKRNKKTFRGVQLCSATVTIRVSSTGQEFELIALNTKHNHQVDPVLFRHLPQQRKLPKEIREEAKRLLQLKANKHLIRQKLEEESHTVIKLKDLNNLRQEDRVQYRNNIESSVKKINEKFESDCHLLIDHDNVFKGLMFVTPTMRNAMKAYPEILCLDATYKLLNIRAPVYFILIEDGDGESQVVAVGILLSEDHESLRWFLEAFKEMNPSWINTKNIMADKDLNEREVLKLCFPQAQILICLFHVFKIFQTEITTEKMKITSLERNQALELLHKITFSKSVEEFEKIKLEISNSLPQVVVTYLEQHWVDIRDEWCPYLGEKVLNLMNRTNNRVENINSKLKVVITKNSTLEEILEHLFVILKSLDKERQNRLAEKINKRPTLQYKKNSPEYSYLL